MAETFYKKLIASISGDNTFSPINSDTEALGKRDERLRYLANKLLSGSTNRSHDSITHTAEDGNPATENNTPKDSVLWSDPDVETIVVKKDDKTVTVKIGRLKDHEDYGTIRYEKYVNDELVYSVDKNIYTKDTKDTPNGSIELICIDRSAENKCYDESSKITSYKTNVVMINPDGTLKETIERTKVSGLGIMPRSSASKPKKDDSESHVVSPVTDTEDDNLTTEEDDEEEGESILNGINILNSDSSKKSHKSRLINKLKQPHKQKRTEYDKYDRQTRFGKWMMRAGKRSAEKEDIIQWHIDNNIEYRPVPAWKKALAVTGIVIATVSVAGLLVLSIGAINKDGHSIFGEQYDNLIDAANSKISGGDKPIIEETPNVPSQEYVATIDAEGNPLPSDEDPNVYYSEDKGADESNESQDQGQGQ